MYPNKSISPVVATALLLIVAVVAVIGFQTWYQTYSSSILINVENNNIFNNIQVNGVFGNDLYLTSSREDILELYKIVDLNGNTMCEYNSKNKEYFNNTKLILSLNDDSYNETNLKDQSGNNVETEALDLIQEKNDCIFGECFYFNGNDTGIYIDNIIFDYNKEFTLTAWTKYSNGHFTLFNSDCNNWYGGISMWGGNLNTRFADGTLGFNTPEIYLNNITNSWHMITIIRNDNKFLLYFDTNLIQETINNSLGILKSGDLRIGNKFSVWDPEFTGYIDEISVYSKVLNNKELEALYNLRKAIPYEQILIDGVRKINISSCNLTIGKQYNFIGFTDTQTVDQIFIAK